VGRERELELLESALERALAGNGQVLGIVADPGVGKSRLCLEFVERCRARGIFALEGHCPSHGRTAAYLPILEIWRSYFGIAAEDDAAEARRKVAGTLLLLDERFRDALPLVFEFLGSSDSEDPPPRMEPEAKQRQLLLFVRRLTDALSEKRPFVVLIDDLHWIDRASEAFVAAFAEAVSARRVLFLVNFRPEYAGAGWMKGAHYQQLPLLPLGPEASTALLDDLLGNGAELSRLRDLIRSRTAGNPFFIEEVVLSLAESGVLRGTRGRYRQVRDVQGTEIPATVHAVLAARIDRLAEREKRVVQAASVVGKIIPEPILRTVVKVPESDLAAAVSALRDVELLYDEAIYPEARFAFKHPLTQEVAYHSLLVDRRRDTHAAVARALAEQYPERLDERAAEIAQHWEGAREPVEAARWHARAAEWAGVSDPRVASSHWRKVRELLGSVPESREGMEVELLACSKLL
ncbi:MAG: ATP-binding protein, partial [Candidatus Binatia bacterium]